MINGIQPWIGCQPSQKIRADYLTRKSESAQDFFWTVVAFDRPEPSDLSLRTEDPVRQNLDEKGNIIWARKERKFKKKKEGSISSYKYC